MFRKSRILYRVFVHITSDKSGKFLNLHVKTKKIESRYVLGVPIPMASRLGRLACCRPHGYWKGRQFFGGLPMPWIGIQVSPPSSWRSSPALIHILAYSLTVGGLVECLAFGARLLHL